MTPFHALVLNLHQPSGNLEHLLRHRPSEAREILLAYDRIPRSLWGFEDLARVHLTFSGTLLETLSSPELQFRVYGDVDLGAMLWHFQNPALFEQLGTGYYHPVLPLVPEADRKEHLARWRGIASHLFWRTDFQGFWPPEMGFSMELIPLLRAMGYRYVLVDGERLEPVGKMSRQDLLYRPHLARHGDAEILVVARDRELSEAQAVGTDPDRFAAEVARRTRGCDFPPLVTTATDGENGAWFRDPRPESNFWTAFYRPLLERVRASDESLRPIFLRDYLDRFGAHGEVRVRADAGDDEGGLARQAGSPGGQRLLERIRGLSGEIHGARWYAGERGLASAELDEALWRLLRAETSCNLGWDAEWVERAEADLDQAAELLEHGRRALPGGA